MAENVRKEEGAGRAALRGVEGALPIVLGYLPIGMAYGLLAQQKGLSAWVVTGLSLLVFAGGSQFIAVSMISSGAGVWSIVGTTFVVNFRHLLMSASIAPRLNSWGRASRLLLGATLTDEAFGVHSARLAQGELEPAESLALNFTAYAAWGGSGLIGFYLGFLISEPRAWGLDFALPAMFIGLMTPLCRRRPAAAAALCGAATSTLLLLAGAGRSAIIAGALVGATAGVFVGEGTSLKGGSSSGNA